MRSAPSAADRELIAELAEHGYTVTATQLERWRQRGLLPRARVLRSGFGGTSIAPHDEETLEAAALLSVVSGRGTPWQYSALALFEEYSALSTPAVRGAATFLVARQTSPLRRAWHRAEAEIGPMADSDDEVTAIAERAVHLVGRAVRATVRGDVAQAHPTMSASGIRIATERALLWRLADLFAPLRLTEEQRNLARHGLEEPMDPIGRIGVIVLPRERELCARTITWAEASVLRPIVADFSKESELLESRLLLDMVTWRLTIERSRLDLEALDRPLRTARLQRIANDFAEEKESQSEDSGEDGAGSDGENELHTPA